MMADVTGTLESVPIDWQHPEPARASAPAAARSWSQRLRRALMRSAEAPAAGENTAANTRPDPLAIRQRLYGRGYVIPGDAAWLLALVAPFRLGASSALLDLAAGLGGPARTVAQAFHARVTGIERDHDCARLANAMSAALGAAHLVRIKTCDPETLALGSAKFDGALGRDATYAVAAKERFLRVVAQALRPGGRIVLTDFVLDRSAGERPELDLWQSRLARRPALWTAAQYADCFKSVGYGLGRAEDISALYRRQIVAAWTGYLRVGAIRGQPAAQVDAVLAEAEASFRSVAALESGALKYYRFEASADHSFR